MVCPRGRQNVHRRSLQRDGSHANICFATNKETCQGIAPDIRLKSHIQALSLQVEPRGDNQQQHILFFVCVFVLPCRQQLQAILCTCASFVQRYPTLVFEAKFNVGCVYLNTAVRVLIMVSALATLLCRLLVESTVCNVNICEVTSCLECPCSVCTQRFVCVIFSLCLHVWRGCCL